MIAESSCTVYRYNGTGYDRFYILACHWQENRASNVIKSGLQTADSVTVYIPADIAVIAPNNSLYPADRLFPGMEAIPQNTSKDMLVKGMCDFEFNNTTAQKVSESMKTFRQKYPQFVTVSSIDHKLYGLKALRHIKVSAK